MKEKKELVLRLPKEVIKNSSGFAFDFGGSLLKVVYYSKKDEQDISNETDKFVQLRLVTFGSDEIVECLAFLKEHAALNLTSVEPTTIFTTGVGTLEHGQSMCEQLNARMVNRYELVCVMEAFAYLSSKLSRTDFLQPYMLEAGMAQVGKLHPIEGNILICAAEQTTRCRVKNRETNNNTDYTPEQVLGRVTLPLSEKPLDQVEDIYPCAVVVAGSALVVFLLNRDGSYSFDFTLQCGKSLLGLSSILLGCNNFDELIAMAASGDRRNVDVCTDDLVRATSDAEVYKKLLPDNVFLYNFGKCDQKNLEDFKHEDLAVALVQYVVNNVADYVYSHCLAAHVKRVFFCGSLVVPELIRGILTTELVRRNIDQVRTVGETGLEFDFIKPCSYLAALGAMILQMDEGKKLAQTPED